MTRAKSRSELLLQVARISLREKGGNWVAPWFFRQLYTVAHEIRNIFPRSFGAARNRGEEERASSYWKYVDDLHGMMGESKKRNMWSLWDSQILGSIAQRATKEWERCICENKAFAILNKTQAEKSAIIKKDGSEMLVAIVLEAAVKALVEDPTKLIAEIMQILQPSSGGSRTRRFTQPNEQQDRFQWTCIRSWILPTWETHDWSNP